METLGYSIKGTVTKKMAPPQTNFSENFGPPWNLFFKRQLKNMDPVELTFQKTVEKYGPHG